MLSQVSVILFRGQGISGARSLLGPKSNVLSGEWDMVGYLDIREVGYLGGRISSFRGDSILLTIYLIVIHKTTLTLQLISD